MLRMTAYFETAPSLIFHVDFYNSDKKYNKVFKSLINSTKNAE